MSLTIRAQNFRSLVDLQWEVPPGLSVLAGANGAGKTTFIFVVDILRRATARDGDLAAVLAHHGGVRNNLRYFGADEDAAIVLGATLDGVQWSIEPQPDHGGLAPHAAERLVLQGNTEFFRSAGASTFEWRGTTMPSDRRTILRKLADADLQGTFPGRPLLDTLEHCRVYYDYNLWQVRRGSEDTNQTTLQRNGANVFSVLRNWRDKSTNHGRYDFVVESLRECFGFFAGFEFERGGNVIEGWIKHRAFDNVFPAGHSANGFLVALLHLTAVASASRGQLVCIDEIESTLHPRALLRMLALLHEYADNMGISVVTTSQSPQVLDWFDAHPEQVYILDKRHLPGPKPITQLRSEEWLSHFRIGRKYADGDFGVEP